MGIPTEILQKYNMVPMEQFKQDWGDSTETERQWYQTFLIQTDHIPRKIFESFIDNMATASLTETFGVIINFFKDVKVTYNEVLTARKTARDEINKLNKL